MPNPSIAIAVGSYVGSINIADTSCFVPRDELSRVLPNL